MGQYIGLAKAAHLLGISRHELQRLAHSGDLATFEGGVDLDQLRLRFPTLAMDEGSVMERLTFLQQTAFSRRVRETVMPESAEDLSGKLKKRTADLAVERARAEKYCAILREMAGKVASLQLSASPETRLALEELNGWLLARLDSV
jgi:CDP-4-dehydro-6-deoxyglucose reductase